MKSTLQSMKVLNGMWNRGYDIDVFRNKTVHSRDLRVSNSVKVGKFKIPATAEREVMENGITPI